MYAILILIYLLKYTLSKSYLVKPVYFVLKCSMISTEVKLKFRIFSFEFRKPSTQDLL